jgi:hypothetical protein
MNSVKPRSLRPLATWHRLLGNGLLTVEKSDRSPGDLELGFELGDGLAGLGQLVGLEALDALRSAGVDQRLAPPQVERGL